MILQSVIRCSGSPHWFSESKSPLSETDDVHKVFINTQSMKYCDIIPIASYKICTKYFICFKMKPMNHTD